MSELSLIYLCRFCAKEQPEQSVIDLKKSENQRHSVEQMLSIFNEEIIDFSNNLPGTVCIECISSLNTFYEFFVQVKQAQVVLNKGCQVYDDDVKDNPNNILAKHKTEISIPNLCTDVDFKPGYAGMSWLSYPWHCLHCETILPSVEELRAHCQVTHNICCGFRCDNCEEQTDSFDEFVEHVRGHRPYLKNYCQYCNMEIDTPTHMQTHTEITCTHCGQQFPSRTSLKTHLNKYSKFAKRCVQKITKKSETFNGIHTAEGNPEDNDLKANYDKDALIIVVTNTDNKAQHITTSDVNKKPDDDDSEFDTSFQMDIDTDDIEPLKHENDAVDQKDDAIKRKDYTTKRKDDTAKRKNDTTKRKEDTTKKKDDTTKRKDDTTKRKDDTTKRKDDTTKKKDDTTKRKDDITKSTNIVKSLNFPKIETWSEYPCICKVCNQMFKSRDLLLAHCMKTHKTCFAMKCVDCEQDASETFVSFVQHVTEHRPQLIDICHYCDSPITDPEHPRTHIGPIQCLACGLHFQNVRQFDAHHGALATLLKQTKKLQVTGKPSLTNTKFVCDICGECLLKKDALRQHLKTHEKRRPRKGRAEDVVCHICYKRLKNESCLKSHHNIVHTQRTKDVTCDRCGKLFYTIQTMEAHRQLHDTIKREKCKICEKCFKTVSHLKKHVKTHNLVMPFQCDDCNKLFSSKANLRCHVAVHMDFKPHVCQYCSKRFRNKGTLRNHVRLHTGDKPYRCEECLKYFACWSSWEQHMQRCHGRSLRATVLTSHGRLELDPATGQPGQLTLTSEVQEWTRNMLSNSRKRRRKDD